jgi:GNAT superfamily N-acetyltransferase
MSLTIRKAEARDIAMLAGLMTELSGNTMSPDQMADRLQFIEKSPFDSLYVCTEGDRVLGVLGFRLRENLEEASPSRYGEISIMVVNKEARRKGVGRFFMVYAEKLARENGCKGTWLVSGFAREEEAHLFYKRLGYKINGYRFVKLFE